MNILRKRKIEKYLACKGLIYWGKDNNIWFNSDGTCNFHRFIIDNSKAIDFTGESTGYLEFKRSKAGRRYIQFIPGRCYID